jgi:hypothetical protein
MLTEMQKTILRMAAREPVEVRNDRINDAIRLIKTQSPRAFFHDTEKKADPDMAKRVFYDQPYSLLPEQYASHVVEYKGAAAQVLVNKKRSTSLLTGKA